MHRRMAVPRPARLWPCVAHAVDVIVLWLYCARIIVCVRSRRFQPNVWLMYHCSAADLVGYGLRYIVSRIILHVTTRGSGL